MNTSQMMDVSSWRGIVDGGLPPAARTYEEYADGISTYCDAFADEARFRRVTDANESAIFAGALEYWISETIDQAYPMYMADTLIPMKTSIPPGAHDVVTYGYDQTGEARILANYGEDIPRVDLHARRMTSPMISLAAAFAVTLQQVREAAMVGMGGSGQQQVPIESLGLAAVRRVLAARRDLILSTGDATVGCQGILNVTGVVPGAFTTGGWNAVGAATAAQIDADVSTAVAAIEVATNFTFRPDTLLLPTTAYNYIMTLPMFIAGGPTVLDWLRDKHELNVVKWWRCDGAGAGGVDRAMLFTNTREVIEGYTSIDVELLAPEYRSTYWLTVGHSRVGGCNSAQILAIGYYDNV